ncbi:MAG: hypothetical protein WEF86_01135 [Gemmatimonadota bacterium]
MRNAWWTLALAVSALHGCEPSAESGDVDGMAGDAIAITEELRIGGLDGAEEYTFGRVSTLAPGPDGSVFVADAQIAAVRRYDAQGRHQVTIGRRGEGPGEFQSIDGLAVLDDGRMIAWDGGLRRLSIFADNEFIESATVPGGLQGWRGFAWSRAGDLLVRITPETGFAETRDGVVGNWARVTLSGDVTRLWPLPQAASVGPRYVVAGRGGYYRPFITETLSTVGPDGSLYQVRNDEYRIRRTHPDGTGSVIAREEPRIELTAEELEEWEARSESFAQRIPEERSEFFPVPTVKPYIRELVTDPDGRLWVSRYTEPEFLPYTEAQQEDRRSRNLPSFQWRDRLRWDVFSPANEYLGSVTLPPRTSFVTAIGNDVWGVQSGEFDEDYVVRFSVAPSPRSVSE